MAQLPAPVLNRQFEEDPQRDSKTRNTRAEPSKPFSVPVKEHTMLLQALNDNQLGFQESLSRNQSEKAGLIAGTRGLELCVLRALVRKTAIPKIA